MRHLDKMRAFNQFMLQLTEWSDFVSIGPKGDAILWVFDYNEQTRETDYSSLVLNDSITILDGEFN